MSRGHILLGVAVREAVMDYAACNVVYVDRAAPEERLVKREDATSTESSIDILSHSEGPLPARRNPSAVNANLQTLLGTFSEGSCRFSIQWLKITPTNIPQSISAHLASLAYQSSPN